MYRGTKPYHTYNDTSIIIIRPINKTCMSIAVVIASVPGTLYTLVTYRVPVVFDVNAEKTAW